jgi:UPF0755 protein
LALKRQKQSRILNWDKSRRVVIYSISFLFVILCLLGLGTAYWFQHPQKNNKTIVLIEKGASLSQITTTLSQNQVLSFPFLFKALLYGSGSWRELKAGEYLIPPAVTPAQLIHILKSGDVILHPVTLVEGETSHHLVQKLLQDARFQGGCPSPPEGSLLPETYHFPRGTERTKIVERMQKAMKDALSNIWAKKSMDCELKSPEDLLALASIIERETALPQEKPLVAAVFVNRLKQGMPLQADPTVIYGLTFGKGDLGRNLTIQDLKTDNPYNTYIYLGLPPTPIANPSLSSLKAAASPANVSYLYFVADGKGGHVFSTTLEDHQKNHETWRKVRDIRQ